MRRIVAGVAAFAVVVCLPVVAQAAKQEPRSGLGACRIAAQALAGYLQRQQATSSEYAHAYRMIETCGLARTAKMKAVPVRPVSNRLACGDLAIKMLDELDEKRLNRPSFVAVREEFAVKCGPVPRAEPKAPGRN